MARKAGAILKRAQPARAGGRMGGVHAPRVDQSNIDAVGKETMERAARTLSALRVAIASWNTSPDKPEELRPKFQKYRLLHDALLGWQRKALKVVGRKGAFDEKVETLWEFVDICQTYA